MQGLMRQYKDLAAIAHFAIKVTFQLKMITLNGFVVNPL